MSGFIKERCVGRCIVRWNSYTGSLNVILAAFEEAKKDFPWLTPEHTEVIKYGGDRIRRTFGIEFNVHDLESIPNDYTPLHQIHLTL